LTLCGVQDVKIRDGLVHRAISSQTVTDQPLSVKCGAFVSVITASRTLERRHSMSSQHPSQ